MRTATVWHCPPGSPKSEHRDQAPVADGQNVQRHCQYLKERSALLCSREKVPA